MSKLPTMRVLAGCALVLVAAGCSSSTAGHSVQSSTASTASSSTSASTSGAASGLASASSAASTTQAGGGAGGGGGSGTTARSTSKAPIPTPSPITPVTSIAGVKATFNSNNPDFAQVAGTYTCTSGTGNLRLGLTHEKNGVPNEYDGPTPGVALNCNGASVTFGPTTLNLDSGNDTWNNHDPVTVQVIFKFADGSTQAQSANVMATG